MNDDAFETRLSTAARSLVTARVSPVDLAYAPTERRRTSVGPVVVFSLAAVMAAAVFQGVGVGSPRIATVGIAAGNVTVAIAGDKLDVVLNTGDIRQTLVTEAATSEFLVRQLLCRQLNDPRLILFGRAPVGTSATISIEGQASPQLQRGDDGAFILVSAAAARPGTEWVLSIPGTTVRGHVPGFGVRLDGEEGAGPQCVTYDPALETLK